MKFIDIARNLPRPVKNLFRFFLVPQYYISRWKNIFFAYIGGVPGGSHIIFVAGYPKSGTTWVENFISNLPGYSPRTLYGSDKVLRNHGLPFNAFDKISKKYYSSVKTHINPDEENISILIQNNIKKVLVMWRDPRDIIISNYYHVLKDNPWDKNDTCYADYTKMAKDDGISHSMNIILGDYESWVRGWVNVESGENGIDCMFLAYEELRSDPKLAFERIAVFFDVKLNESELIDIMEKSNGNSNKGWFGVRVPGLKSTKRSGTIGAGIKEFNDEQKQVIKSKVGELLIDLGYEQDFDW